MAIRQYIADSSAFPAFDLPVPSQGAVRSRLAHPRLIGSSGELTRTAGDHSLSSIAIH
ncbi:hypothetical protein LRP30_27750 [Bradyrhizobium sp. C-145]|uniref:hypothetical protein n=1 Tax=Bradyrhizobium sp. C-145 TaxID=574727 RepID=UPI00201B4D43|nr:hypothetical protein [Bradyrhizobium sp. C-145]UQR60777.1 hypothetical protein LRP30_27750 [Bradyrhizobium sp. C-145]